MKNELEKITFYVEEAVRRGGKGASFSPDRGFYELWENIHRPLSFSFAGRKISIAGQDITLEGAGPFTGSFRWSDENKCAMLLLEGEENAEKILIFCEGRKLRLQHERSAESDDSGFSFGETLEVFMDLVDLLMGENGGEDIFNITLTRYRSALKKLGDRHPPRLLSFLARFPAPEVKKMIRRATWDKPPDEIGLQLRLPLDGAYRHEVEDGQGAYDDTPALSVIPRRTSWAAQRDMLLLRDAAELAKKNEKAWLLPFAEAELLESSGLSATFKITVDDGTPVQEGDILSVYHLTDEEKIGTFLIDILDCGHAYGRIRYFDLPETLGLRQEDMFGRPPPSPLGILSAEMHTLAAMFESGSPPPLLRNVTGMDETSFRPVQDADKFQGLDQSQRTACLSALDTSNKIILVQGPPGTGKTSTLSELLRALCTEGRRVLVTAPSNTAVDNICRKLEDLPLLRFGNTPGNIAADIRAKYWIGEKQNVTRFVSMRRQACNGGIFAGTHTSLIKDIIVRDDVRKNGPYDVVVFDEAGMATVSEFLMLSALGSRAVLFGDHKQLPPFPLPSNVLRQITELYGTLDSNADRLLRASALEWLAHCRGFPVLMLNKSYRCQNPRLLKFSSTLFYDAMVQTSGQAEYFSLPYHLRAGKYPPETMRLVSTSSLPEEIRNEKLAVHFGKPGIENRAEALICADVLYEMLHKFQLLEICIISMYKRQVKLIREILSRELASSHCGEDIGAEKWELFLSLNVATVDSFQGAERDAVIISYCRSNKEFSAGFTHDPNRINVAHTRCRREIVVIGDFECLKKSSGNVIFERLERSFARDGKIVGVSLGDMDAIQMRVAPVEVNPDDGRQLRISQPASAGAGGDSLDQPDFFSLV